MRQVLYVTATLIAATLVAATIPGGIVRAQETNPAAGAKTGAGIAAAAQDETSVTPEQLDKLAAQVEADEMLDAEKKKAILDTIGQARTELTRTQQLRASIKSNQELMNGLEERVASRRKDAEAEAKLRFDDLPVNPSTAELRSAVSVREQQLQDARTATVDQQAASHGRAKRIQTILEQNSTRESRRKAIEEQIGRAVPADEHPLATTARSLLLKTRLEAILAEGPALQQELASYATPGASELAIVDQQYQRAVVARLEGEIKDLNARINRKADVAARKTVDDLRAYAETLSDELLKSVATETVELAEVNVTLTRTLKELQQELEVTTLKLAELRSSRQQITNKVDRVGLSAFLGIELRKQRNQLADPAELRAESRKRQELVQEVEYDRLKKGEEINELLDVEQREGMSETEKKVLLDRRATLQQIVGNRETQFIGLARVDSLQQELAKETDEFRRYIDEHALWISSDPWLSLSGIRPALADTARLLQPDIWTNIGHALVDDATRHLAEYILFTCLVFLLIAFQKRSRNELQKIGEVARRSTCCDYGPTLRATYLTLLITVLWPVVMGFIGWRLNQISPGGSLAFGIGRALFRSAFVFFTLNLIRHICRTGGLAACHFDWTKQTNAVLRRHCHTLMVAGLPILFFGTALHNPEATQDDRTLERVLFIVLMILFAYVLARMLHPSRGILKGYLLTRRTSLLFRTRWLLFWCIVGTPLILAGLTVRGNHYTALELGDRMAQTVWLLISLAILRGLLLRWFVISNRQLRIEIARKQRAKQASTADSATGESTSNIPLPTSPSETSTLVQVGEQTRRLVGTGLVLVGLLSIWFLWIDVLPALGYLNRWELWSTTVEQNVEALSEDGQRVMRSESIVQPVTLASLLVVVTLTIVTVTASRNIPGLIELILLQRLPLEASIRFAIQSITRYLIVIVGTAAVFTTLGLGWGKVQWLVAALTVGLGFGLQEIFANFVSGLIILFERPVRIGDVVTIDGVSGCVSRIQIRATTIMDWDRKEYIVPNKELVTGRVLNWTLTDTTNRVVINVGIAYGTDTRRAAELLLQVARNHPNVLNEPPPIATFEAFGDSSLNLVLRAYLPSLENRLAIVTELHHAIAETFRREHIEIAFPQLDVHVRSGLEAMGKAC